MSSQPGWHLDPVPPQPGQPTQLRYWDGTRWTEHVAPAQPPAQQAAQQPAQPAQPAQPPGQHAQPPQHPAEAAVQYGAAPAYAGIYGAPYAGTERRAATTPDGVPLAGWWQRVLAYVLDAIIVGLVAGIIALPWVREVLDVYVDWFDQAMRAGGTGTGTGGSIDTAQLQRDLAGPLAYIVGIQLVLGFCYHVGFLRWKQATPGKLVVGLRVRLRDRPGPMSLGTVLMRWLGQFAVGIFGLIPFVGSLTGLYSLLDVLWPLWDDKRQAVHDKIAKTNVVRIR